MMLFETQVVQQSGLGNSRAFSNWRPKARRGGLEDAAVNSKISIQMESRLTQFE